jgi:hypothetical protein
MREQAAVSHNVCVRLCKVNTITASKLSRNFSGAHNLQVCWPRSWRRPCQVYLIARRSGNARLFGQEIPRNPTLGRLICRMPYSYSLYLATDSRFSRITYSVAMV